MPPKGGPPAEMKLVGLKMVLVRPEDPLRMPVISPVTPDNPPVIDENDDVRLVRSVDEIIPVEDMSDEMEDTDPMDDSIDPESSP